MLNFDSINKNFNVDDYCPLELTALTDTFNQVSVSLNMSFIVSPRPGWMAQPFTISMTGKFSKLKTDKYPCVVLSSRGGWDYIFIDFTQIEWDEISGTYTDYYGQQYGITGNTNFSQALNTTIGSIVNATITECTLPIALCYTNEAFPDFLKYYFVNYDYPSLDEYCLNYYQPISRPITEAMIKTAVNTIPEENEQEGLDFYIMNPYRQGTWTEYGESSPGVTAFRNIRGKIGHDGRIAFYNIDGISSGALKVGVKVTGTITGIQTSENAINWTDSPTFPWSFFYRPREDEIGTFYYGLSFSNNIVPFFEDEETAEDYIEGNIDITEASNWPQISSSYEPGNTTGFPASESDFGEVYTRGFFTQQYIMDSTCLSALANDLFDTSVGGVWEDIKKGLDMFGANPMDAVMGLYYFPLSLDSIFTTETASNVWFGGYGWVPSAGSASRLIAPNGYKSLGSVTFNRSFGNWRDFEPYTKLYVELPYCGTYQLDLARYYGKSVEVRYYFDTRSGACLCCLIADGHCVDYFNGQCGCSMPITLTDFSGFARSQIQTLLGAGGQAANNASVGGAALTQAGTSALNAGSAAALGGVALAGTAGAIGLGAALGVKTAYGLSMNNINNFNKTKGGSSAMINQYLPQTVTFMFEIMEDCAPDNYGNMFGYPSMKSGNVGNFTGFLKCQAVKVNAPIATASEKELLKSMLLNGIYI